MCQPVQQPTRAADLCKDFGLTYDTSADQVDILTVDRSKFSWIQSNYNTIMGRLVCGRCGSLIGPFELDHMSPWRPYVIALLGPNEVIQSGTQLLVSRTIVRALYNDPENLWCLCRDCNRAKSDKVYSIEQAIAISKGEDPAGKMVSVRNKKELAALWE